MIRPRLCLATFALLVLGLGAGAEAADPGGVWLAQSAGVVRGPGFYLSTLKLVPVVLIFPLWGYTTLWIDRDTVKADIEQYEMWNAIGFFSGLLGFALVFVIPVYIVGL